MSKSRNSKTQSEAIAEFDAQRAVDPNAGQDTEIPPAVAEPSPEKRTRKNRPVSLEKFYAEDEVWGLVILGLHESPSPKNFPTESAAWAYAEGNNIEGRLRTVIVLDERTATVETVKKVTWA